MIENYNDLVNAMDIIAEDDEFAEDPDELIMAIYKVPKVNMSFREFMEMCFKSEYKTFSDLIRYGIQIIAPTVEYLLPIDINNSQMNIVMNILALLGVQIGE